MNIYIKQSSIVSSCNFPSAANNRNKTEIARERFTRNRSIRLIRKLFGRTRRKENEKLIIPRGANNKLHGDIWKIRKIELRRVKGVTRSESRDQTLMTRRGRLPLPMIYYVVKGMYREIVSFPPPSVIIGRDASRV